MRKFRALKKGKIKSFTVQELIVVMIVASIVVTMSILVLNIVQKEIYVIRHSFNKHDEVKLLERSIWRDLNTYNVSIIADNNRELMFSSVIDTVHYSFDNELVVRNTDTMDVGVKEVKLYRNNFEVTINADAILLVIDDIKTKELFFFKKNSAESYMNENGI